MDESIYIKDTFEPVHEIMVLIANASNHSPNVYAQLSSGPRNVNSYTPDKDI